MRSIIKVIGWIIRFIPVVVILTVIVSVAYYYLTKPAEPPPLAEAPWVIQTFSNDQYKIPSRFYFASKVEVLKDGTTQATTWWSYNGKGYEKHEGVILFSKEVYGNVDIKRRKE